MSSASVRMRSAAVALGAFALVVGSVKLVHLAKLRGVTPAQAALEPAAANVAPRIELPKEAAPEAPSLAGLDLARITVSDAEATVALPRDRVAHLTVDPRLQRAAVALVKLHRLPEATIVMMDPDTGAILAYVSHGASHDLAVEATAPSASVFKMVTATALVEKEGIGPDTRACFPRSAGQRIVASDLIVDPLRDKWCESVATAMGKSENAVFARLAHEKLDKATLEDAAHAFGYGAPIAFDVPVQPGKLEIPDGAADGLGFARTAAGFWNTTLSPLQAAFMSATVARGGDAIRPRIVARITDASGRVEWQAPTAPETHRAISDAAAQALTTMMEHTVTEGTSYRAFHDAHRTAFVPVPVAGKTGTLTGEGAHGSGPRLYTWFTGFAPSHPRHRGEAAEPATDTKRVAIAVLVVNKPRWHVKANVVAREMLREFYRGEHPAPVASR